MTDDGAGGRGDERIEIRALECRHLMLVCQEEGARSGKGTVTGS